MTQKQIVHQGNLLEMLTPCLTCKDSYTYNVFELEHEPNKNPITYSFDIRGTQATLFPPREYKMSGGLNGSVSEIKKVADHFNITPIAFVTTKAQGKLSPNAFVRYCSYDMSKHEDFDVKIRDMKFADIIEESKVMTRLYKFIFRHNQTNQIIPMPYYVPVEGDDWLLDRIARDGNLSANFAPNIYHMMKDHQK